MKIQGGSEFWNSLLAWSIQFGNQYDSLLHRKLLFNCQKLTQALTLLQCEFGFSSRSVQTLLKAVENEKERGLTLSDFSDFN